MTDGLSFIARTPDAPFSPDAPDLSSFATWIAIQPIAVHVGLLELIANDLYRRHHGMQAGEIKHVARDLRALSSYQKKEGE